MQRSGGPLFVSLCALLALAPAASGARVPGAQHCPVFPRDNAWNQRVDRLPVAADSARIVSSIGFDGGLHADFGSGRYQGRPIGIPFDVVSRRTHRSRVRFDYADESNRVRYDEVRRGHIDHALRFTVSQTRSAFVFPARHFASSLSDPALPRMGERLRLRKNFDVSGLPHQARVVARALKEYGMLVADNGSDWYLSGAPNAGWNNDALHRLGGIRGSDFDVVRAG